MEIHAINILYDFCIMSALLFVAKILRSKIKFIQKLYIPSSLLAGVIGLFLGKYFFERSALQHRNLQLFFYFDRSAFCDDVPWKQEEGFV